MTDGNPIFESANSSDVYPPATIALKIPGDARYGPTSSNRSTLVSDTRWGAARRRTWTWRRRIRISGWSLARD